MDKSILRWPWDIRKATPSQHDNEIFWEWSKPCERTEHQILKIKLETQFELIYFQIWFKSNTQINLIQMWGRSTQIISIYSRYYFFILFPKENGSHKSKSRKSTCPIKKSWKINTLKAN